MTIYHTLFNRYWKKVRAVVKEEKEVAKVDLASLEREIHDNVFLVLATLASAINLIAALIR